MNLLTQISNRTFATAATLLAIITFAVHGYNRLSHHVVSTPSPDEKQAAFLFFMITTLVAFSVPIVLTVLKKQTRGDKNWPIYEAIAIAVGFFLAFVFAFVSDLIPGSLGAYQDVVGVFLAYILVVNAYSFSISKVIASAREEQWYRVFASGGVLLLTGSTIFIVSWMMVYFE